MKVKHNNIVLSLENAKELIYFVWILIEIKAKIGYKIRRYYKGMEIRDNVIKITLNDIQITLIKELLRKTIVVKDISYSFFRDTLYYLLSK